jgi:hypothetical protein
MATTFTRNAAGMPVPDDATDDQPCWVCGEPDGGFDGLCTGCGMFVLIDGDLSRLDRWDAEAAKRGLPPIDRDAWRAFYGDHYASASPGEPSR